jgi:DNA segregation ATPase FtsK/SpoIIIE-like protein
VATASTSCPPPKRIKTAVLAKKLLAAAAVIDPTKLPKSEERKNVSTESMDGEKELNKTEGESAMENLIEENEKDGGDMMMEEMEGTTIEEDLQQKQRANSISSTASQEQKKVCFIPKKIF